MQNENLEVDTNEEQISVMYNPAHPGEVLASFIDGLREETGDTWCYQEVEANIGVTESELVNLVVHLSPISIEMAKAWPILFENSHAELWLRIQHGYDTAPARRLST